MLVIIAILVATTLPALTGYIQDADDKVAIAEARSYLVAAQSISSELYGMGVSMNDAARWLNSGVRGAIPASYTTTVASLTGNNYFSNYISVKTLNHGAAGTSNEATVMAMELYTSNGRSVAYEDGQMRIGKIK